MIVFDAYQPLSVSALEAAREIVLELIAEHDGPYSGPWREEKTRRVTEAVDRPNATLHDLTSWLDPMHRMRFLMRVGDRPMAAPVRDELISRMFLKPEDD